MNKQIIILFIVIILLGGLLRFYQIDRSYIDVDEVIYIFASAKYAIGDVSGAQKLESQHPESPKKFLSLFIISDKDSIKKLPLNSSLFYTSFGVVKENYVPLRLVSAAIGTILISILAAITYLVYDKKSAIYAGILGAASFDMVILSRLIYLDVYLFFFMGLVLLSYILYKKTGKQMFLISLAVSVFLLLNTKSGQPVIFLVPILISELLIKSPYTEKTKIFTSVFVGLIPYFLFFSPQTSNAVFGLDFFDSHIFYFPLTLIIMNSPLFLFGLVVFAINFLGRIKKDWQNISKSTDFVLIIVALFLFIVMLPPSRLGITPRYVTMITVPLIPVISYRLSLIKNQKIPAVLAIISVTALIFYSPYYENYPAYNIKNFGYEYYMPMSQVTSYLSANNHPTVFTDNYNILIFYNNSAVLDDMCGNKNGVVITARAYQCPKEILYSWKGESVFAYNRNCLCSI